jgi:hypothetical protein
MRAVLVWLGALSILYGQNCVPADITPGSQVSGSLDPSSCQLSDGTAYASYRLTLPVRGQVQLNLTTSAAGLGLILRDSTGAQLASGAGIAQPLEAGSYTVLVNGQKPGQLGTYTIQAGFSAEAGMWCTAFPSLGLNETVNGVLGASGCQAPDTTVYDAYWVNTFGSGMLSLAVSNAAFQPVVTVRDGTGVALATGQGSVSVPVGAASQYQVVVSTLDAEGAYQLAASFQQALADPCVAQQNFSGAGQDANAITGNGCWQAVDGSSDLVYFNYYTLSVTNAGVAEITATSKDFHPTIYLLDSAGNPLAYDAGGAGGGNSDIRIQLPSGSYTVQVFSDVPSGGTYSLTYSFTTGPPTGCATTAATAGTSISGTLSVASCRTDLGLADLYTITLPSAGTLGAVLQDGFAGRVAIRDAKDSLIVQNADLGGIGTASISAFLPAGSYMLIAAAASGSGAYQLIPSFQAQPAPACAQPPQVPVNTGYRQMLGGSGCIGPDGQPMDSYQFTMLADGVAAVIMTSTDVHGFLVLTDAAGNFLRSDAGSYAPNDPMIVQFLRAGTYQLGARGSGAAGLYQVTVLAAAGARPAFCAPVGTISPGDKITGAITFTGCQYPDGTFAQLYQLNLASAGIADLRLDSPDFSAYLVLLDAKGNLVAQDAGVPSGPGGATNAHIVQQLDAGTYFVVAKPFAYYYSTGGYTLSFQPPAAQ